MRTEQEHSRTLRSGWELVWNVLLGASLKNNSVRTCSKAQARAKEPPASVHASTTLHARTSSPGPDDEQLEWSVQARTRQIGADFRLSRMDYNRVKTIH